MPTTLVKLSEQILAIAKGGDPSAGSDVELGDVKELVIQTINRQLKIETLTNRNISGESIPNGCVMATYDNIPVAQYKNVAKAVLPAMPISLPKNIGLFHIGPMGVVEIDPAVPSSGGGDEVYVFTATGGETSFSHGDLVGKTILLAFRAGWMEVIETGTPNFNQLLYTSSTGTFSWHPDLAAFLDEKFAILYR